MPVCMCVNAQVKTLEVKTRELLNAKLSVLSGREMVEEDKRYVWCLESSLVDLCDDDLGSLADLLT